MGNTTSNQRRKTETAVLDSRGRPVQLLYDEANDKTIMARGNADGATTTVGTAKICSCNSTAAQLAGGAKFTGTPGDINGYATLLVTLYSDQDSVTDGFKLFFSHDDSPYDWHEADSYTYTATSYKTYSFQPVDRYFKIEYTNGAVQTVNFHITARMHSSNVKGSSHRMADDIKGQDDAELVKAILAAEKAGGAGDVYTNIQSTAGGNLKVSVEEFDGSAILPQSNSYNHDEINDQWDVAELDPHSGAGVAIEEEHHKIHVGMHFFVKDYADLAINNVLDLLLVTHASSAWLPHMTWLMRSESEALWQLYEGAAITVAGTNVPILNNDRSNTTNTSTSVASFHLNTSLALANADTDVTGATEIMAGIIGSGRGGDGNHDRSNEIMLKGNTVYVYRLTATAAGYIDYDFHWYEHAPHITPYGL